MKRWLWLLALVGCAEDLKLPGEPGPVDAAREGGGLVPNPTITSRAVDGTITESVVDASWDNIWVYMDLERGLRLEVVAPNNDRVWDLAFQRFKIMSNGGVSGKAGCEVALLPNAILEALSNAPTTGWALDRPDGPDGNMDPDYVFNQGDTWFSYDVDAHVLSARKQIYVVLTGDGSYYGIQMLDYYDASGTGGFLTLRWKKLAPPLGTRIPAETSGGDGGVDGGSDAADGGVDGGA